jgi:hypothetical protein
MTSFEKTAQAINNERRTRHLVKGYLTLEEELETINDKFCSTDYAEEKAKYDVLSEAKETELHLQFEALARHLGSTDAAYEALEA